MIGKFTIPGRLAGMNELIDQNRRNKYAGAKLKKNNQKKVVWAITTANIQQYHKPIILSVIFFEKNKRRDPDNVISGLKFILDGMVQAGVIENDGWKQLQLIEPYWMLDKLNPRIEVTIYEANENGEY